MGFERVSAWGWDMAGEKQAEAGPIESSRGMAVAVEARPLVRAGVPLARPVGSPVLPVAGGGGLSLTEVSPVHGPPVRRRTDGLAIASAVCGFTAVVPVVSQVAGLALGAASLLRIGRARRCGVELPGRGWALAGILSSGFVLLSWIAVLALLTAVGGSLGHTTEAFQMIAPPGG